MKKAAYIDHSFKKKTRSNDFLREILSKEYDLTELWDDSWNGGERVSVEYLNKNEFDTIFFFQVILPPKELKRLKCKKLVWFPMYDAVRNKPFYWFISYLKFNIKIISFCKELYEIIRKAGLECYYYKYHQKPINIKKDIKSIKIFFWMRITNINWNLLIKLIGNNKISKVILKITPDPYQKVEYPNEEDIQKYNIQIIDKWLTKEEYFKLLNECNVFIAPREAEGYGTNVIEALSRGLCVIALDKPAMNEYIIHRKNGLLYDLNKPVELDLSNLAEMCENAAKIAKKDYELWEKTKHKILIDLTKPNKKPRFIKLLYLKSLHKCYLHYHKFRFFLLPLAKIKSLLRKYERRIISNYQKRN